MTEVSQFPQLVVETPKQKFRSGQFRETKVSQFPQLVVETKVSSTPPLKGGYKENETAQLTCSCWTGTGVRARRIPLSAMATPTQNVCRTVPLPQSMKKGKMKNETQFLCRVRSANIHGATTQAHKKRRLIPAAISTSSKGTVPGMV